MRHVTKLLASAMLAATAAAAPASAATIEFNTAQTQDLTTYEQDGYRVSSGTGKGDSFSLADDHPGFGDVLLLNNRNGSTFDVTRTNGGLFSIGSFLAGNGDFSARPVTLSFTLLGFVGGVNTYSETLTEGGFYPLQSTTLTPTPVLNAFDRLNVTFSATRNRAVFDKLNVTDIAAAPPPVAGAVPEPATWAMMIGGFGLMGMAMRRRPAVRVRFA